METVVYRFVFSVPSQGVPIESESDFESLQEGKAMLDPAFEDGQISDYYVNKITTTIKTERVYERSR